MEVTEEAELLRECLAKVGDLGLLGVEKDAEAKDILLGLVASELTPLFDPETKIGAGAVLRCTNLVGDWGVENDADAKDKRDGLCGR